MDRPASVEGLIVAGRVDGQSAEELPLLGHNADLGAGHEEADGFAPVSGSDPDVPEPAAVAQGDGAGLVDAVVTDPVPDGSELSSGAGLDPGGEGLGGGAPSERAVGTGLVVVETEGIELRLEMAQRAHRWLAGEEALEGLVEALDFAAGKGWSAWRRCPSGRARTRAGPDPDRWVRVLGFAPPVRSCICRIALGKQP